MNDSINRRDLALTRSIGRRQASERTTVDLCRTAGGDLATVSGRENLIQAILDRLSTRRGELAALDHPAYGSRLHELVGELDNARTRSWAEIYIRECLAQERRIAEVLAVEMAPANRADERDVLRAEIVLRPVGESESVTLGLTLNLGG